MCRNGNGEYGRLASTHSLLPVQSSVVREGTTIPRAHSLWLLSRYVGWHKVLTCYHPIKHLSSDAATSCGTIIFPSFYSIHMGRHLVLNIAMPAATVIGLSMMEFALFAGRFVIRKQASFFHFCWGSTAGVDLPAPLFSL